MAEIKPDEISAILRQQLSNFDVSAELEEVGTVLQVGDGIARVYGLSNVSSGELVEFENGALRSFQGNRLAAGLGLTVGIALVARNRKDRYRVQLNAAIRQVVIFLDEKDGLLAFEHLAADRRQPAVGVNTAATSFGASRGRSTGSRRH